uniref:Acetyl-coenzyme A carboxylase carboxyl transferase subunit beta, chloroplastic n=1 Tax=Rhipsalis baccifera TaxID=722799 RepID=A0A7L8ZQU8_9CARY|nr:acetyl-CoA carboxylase carboxyltransferase beta subunit [Rhipsalis baccifera]QOI72687.1 acetyl-CoA carboxylase carboxyltransferase beta subunit [Rhipsalis baccifera]
MAQLFLGYIVVYTASFYLFTPNPGVRIVQRNWSGIFWDSIVSTETAKKKWRLSQSKRNVDSAEGGEEGPKDSAKKKRTRKVRNTDKKNESSNTGAVIGEEKEQACGLGPDQNSKNENSNTESARNENKKPEDNNDMFHFSMELTAYFLLKTISEAPMDRRRQIKVIYDSLAGYYAPFGAMPKLPFIPLMDREKTLEKSILTQMGRYMGILRDHKDAPDPLFERESLIKDLHRFLVATNHKSQYKYQNQDNENENQGREARERCLFSKFSLFACREMEHLTKLGYVHNTKDFFSNKQVGNGQTQDDSFQDTQEENKQVGNRQTQDDSFQDTQEENKLLNPKDEEKSHTKDEEKSHTKDEEKSHRDPGKVKKNRKKSKKGKKRGSDSGGSDSGGSDSGGSDSLIDPGYEKDRFFDDTQDSDQDRESYYGNLFDDNDTDFDWAPYSGNQTTYQDLDYDDREEYLETEEYSQDQDFYLLKNRDEPLVHDQEKYLETEEYFLDHDSKKTQKVQKNENESQKNQSPDQNLEETQKYRHLWVQCEDCFGLNYKKYFFPTKLNICEHCGSHLKMSSSDRIELPIDQGTWNPMDEEMVSTDPIDFDGNPTKKKNFTEFETNGSLIKTFNPQKEGNDDRYEGKENNSNCDICPPEFKESIVISSSERITLFGEDQNHPKTNGFPGFPTNGTPVGEDDQNHKYLDKDSKTKILVNSYEDSDARIKCDDSQNSSTFDFTNLADGASDFESKSERGNSKSGDDSEDCAIDFESKSEGGNSKSGEDSEGGNSKSGEDSEDCIDFDSKSEMGKDSKDFIDCGSEYEEKDYKDRINSYQDDTGLTEAVQTGTGQLKGIPIAIGVMDFQFIGGSMGSVVGEKITRLIEYATKKCLPVILVCASGGARMQEGSLSLMQMAKISAALHKYRINKTLFYISILTSPTTGGVTASFGMLGDLILTEPNAEIAFAGKRVIEQTLNITVPEDLQTAENFFQKGLLDLIVPRNLLKTLISELLKWHDFFPVNENQVEHNINKGQLFV